MKLSKMQNEHIYELMLQKRKLGIILYKYSAMKDIHNITYLMNPSGHEIFIAGLPPGPYNALEILWEEIPLFMNQYKATPSLERILKNA